MNLHELTKAEAIKKFQMRLKRTNDTVNTFGGGKITRVNKCTVTNTQANEYNLDITGFLQNGIQRTGHFVVNFKIDSPARITILADGRFFDSDVEYTTLFEKLSGYNSYDSNQNEFKFLMRCLGLTFEKAPYNELCTLAYSEG